jgi:GH24 family phage-related lysozyme (muramidase)
VSLRGSLRRSIAVALAYAVACGLSVPASTARAQDLEAKAFDAANLAHELQGAVRLAGGLKVSASADHLREGQSLVLSIDLPHDGYLNVVSLNPAGEPTVLFPNQQQPDNRVAAGRFALPGPGMPFELRAAAPFGDSLVVAFLTREALDLRINGEGERNAAGALLDRFARLSLAGRDLINLLGTRSLQPGAPPMTAGMVTVEVCASSGPCGEETTQPAIRRIVDAIVPGIFLDKAADLPQPNALLRPMPERGLRLTKASEGFVRRLYHDAAGFCSIAYGHLLRRSGCVAADRKRYPHPIAEPTGEALLLTDLHIAQRAVTGFVSVPLSEGQYASLVDFAYNVGAGNFKRSTLLKAVNAGQHERVPFQLMRWTRAGGQELRGLRTRREREITLYFDGRPVPKSPPRDEDTTPVDIREGEAPHGP